MMMVIMMKMTAMALVEEVGECNYWMSVRQSCCTRPLYPWIACRGDSYIINWSWANCLNAGKHTGTSPTPTPQHTHTNTEPPPLSHYDTLPLSLSPTNSLTMENFTPEGFTQHAAVRSLTYPTPGQSEDNGGNWTVQHFTGGSSSRWIINMKKWLQFVRSTHSLYTKHWPKSTVTLNHCTASPSGLIRNTYARMLIFNNLFT